jgi:hypothetical protein
MYWQPNFLSAEILKSTNVMVICCTQKNPESSNAKEIHENNSSSSLPACLQEGVWCVFLRPAKTAQAAIQELRVTTSQRSHFAHTHPYRSAAAAAAAAAAYITRNKPTHPPTHSPTYPNRSLSRNPKPRPRCVRSKKPQCRN